MVLRFLRRQKILMFLPEREALAVLIPGRGEPAYNECPFATLTNAFAGYGRKGIIIIIFLSGPRPLKPAGRGKYTRIKKENQPSLKLRLVKAEREGFEPSVRV